MNRKWMAAAALLVLMLSVCVFALAEEPTDPVYPGPYGQHEHRVSIRIRNKDYNGHWLDEWCPDCGKLLKERHERHKFVDGVCQECGWVCTHAPEAAKKHYERDGVKPEWDGTYIIGPGWEITECGTCHTVLSRKETTVREFHNVHTHFTPVLECLPHDADTHALIRVCDECGTEVPEYVPHNCPPSDRTYKDDGNSETHSRLVRCADCGFWVPQHQAHTWVHYAYTDFDGMGDYHNEVLHCSVCGAVKQVPLKHEWKLISCNADNGGKTHTSSYECTVCGNCKEMTLPHTLVHYIYKNDGSSEGHIEVLGCTECRQLIDGERLSHTPTRLYWKSISDTQDQLTVQCNLCGLTYQEAPENHKFDAKSYESDGSAAGQHTVYRTCTKCGARDLNAKTVKENHSFSWRVCTECGQAQEHDRGHTPNRDPKGWVSINENQHAAQYLCVSMYPNLCGVIYTDYRTVNNHTFDPITMKCTGCGYLKEGCEHHYTYEPDKYTISAEGHTLIGTCSGCGKQIKVAEAHNMEFFSATEYTYDKDAHARNVTEKCSACGYLTTRTETEAHVNETVKEQFEPCENGHTHMVEHYCSFCGYLISAQTMTEAHTIGSAEFIDDKTHMEECEKCHLIQAGQHNFADNWDDDVNHRCRNCGYEQEHKYITYVSRRSNDDYHVLTYLCENCHHFVIGPEEPHKGKESYRPYSSELHNIQIHCEICDWFMKQDTGVHEFDDNDICKYCNYHRGDSIDSTSLPGEGLSESAGDLITAMPIFCHLTADGKEILCEYAFEPTEDWDAIDLILLPEGISGDSVIEARFTASELELLQMIGIKDIYLRLNENDILLLNDIEQTLTILSEREDGELLITLTPGSEGEYTVQYAPEGVYITK